MGRLDAERTGATTEDDGVPSRGVGDYVRSPEAVGQVRGAAGKASSAVPSVSSATEAAAM